MEWLISFFSIAWTSIVFVLEVVSKLIMLIAICLAALWAASWLKDQFRKETK